MRKNQYWGEKMRLLRFAGKMIKNIRLSAVLIILSLVFSLAAPFCLLNISASLFENNYRSSLTYHGKYTNIIYGAERIESIKEIVGNSLFDDAAAAKTQVDSLVPELQTNQVGTMDCLGSINVSKEMGTVDLGYANESAIALGNFNLLEGKWPTQSGEVVVERSLFYKLNLDPAIDQIIHFSYTTASGESSEMDCKVVGIIDSYSGLWISDKSLDAKYKTPISVFMFQADAQESFQKSGKICTHLLIGGDPTVAFHDSALYSEHSWLLQNSYIAAYYQGNHLRQLPVVVYALVFACAALVLVSAIAFDVQRRQRSLSVLRLLGMTKMHVSWLLINQILGYFIISVPVGFGFGYLGSRVTINLLSAQATRNLVLYTDVQNFLLSIGISLLLIVICAVYICVKLSRSMPIDLFRDIEMDTPLFPKMRLKRMAGSKIIGLARQQLNQNFSSLLFPLVLLSILFILPMQMQVYLSRYNVETQTTEVHGRLTNMYDYGFLLDISWDQGNVTVIDGETQSGGNQDYENTVYFSNEIYNGMTEADLAELRSNPLFTQVTGYKTNLGIDLLLKQNEFDSYFDSVDGTIDGINDMFHEKNSKFLKSFDYTSDDLLISAQMVGFSEEEIMNFFTQYPHVGEIDLDAIRSGEEVIVTAPIRQLITDVGSGCVTSNFLSLNQYNSSDPGMYKDQYLSVGKEITLTDLHRISSGIAGFTDPNEATNIFQRIDKTVRVGAIFYDDIGWAEPPMDMPSTYRIVTLNEAFSTLEIDQTYSRIRLNLAPGADPEQAKSVLAQYAAKYPKLILEDRYSDLNSYKNLRDSITMIGNAVLISLLLIMLVSLLYQTTMITLQKKRDYILLRLNGMTKQGVIGVFLVGLSLLYSMAALIGLIANWLIMHFVYQGDFALKTYLLTCLVLLGSCFLASIPSVFILARLHMSDIRER